jgi:hypothetical protein
MAAQTQIALSIDGRPNTEVLRLMDSQSEKSYYVDGFQNT